jgi:hypothetical protein
MMRKIESKKENNKQENKRQVKKINARRRAEDKDGKAFLKCISQG